MAIAFFSRAMDGLNPDAILANEEKIKASLRQHGITISNTYRLDDNRRKSASGITGIVNDDLANIEKSDFLIADLSIGQRGYVGAIFEIAKASDLGKDVHVWTGDTGIENRIWLQYYATSICQQMDETIRLIDAIYTRRNETRANMIEYYSSLATSEICGADFGDVSKESSHLLYNQERNRLIRWVSDVRIGNSVLDLGSGSGNWIPVWAKNARRIVCVDASKQMLECSRRRNTTSSNIVHINADFFCQDHLESLVRDLRPIDTYVLAFVLGLLTRGEEKELISRLRNVAAPDSQLIILECMQSHHSRKGYFSRMELQHRSPRTENQTYAITKRVFLPHDLKQTLALWGNSSEHFHTENYFLGGVVRRS